MTAAIAQLPDHARLWIYQSTRPFTAAEESVIKETTEAFVGQWAAHGQKLKAAFAIEHHQFLVIAVDESFNLASGCSIDASVNLIRKLQDQFGLNLLDRTQIAFLIDEKIVLKPMNKLKELVAQGEVTGDMTVFNNLVKDAGEWKSGWRAPMKTTWLSRYLQ